MLHRSVESALSVVKFPTQLGGNLPGIRVVRASEGIRETRQKQRVRDVEGRKAHRPLFADLFSERQVRRGVSRHMAGTIASQKSRAVRHAA